MQTRTYIFAGGGTGGHLFPGIAVAHALRRHDPGACVGFFTTDRPLDASLLGPHGFPHVAQSVRPLRGNPLTWPAFWLAWTGSVREARRQFRAQRPAAVLGLGGYAAGPAVVAARRLGIRTAILNPDAVPGRANRLLARYADLVVLQWDVSAVHFPAGTPCRTLGCPIRAEFAELAEVLRDAGRSAVAIAQARQRMGLDPDRPVLLVTGASQGARTINEAMLRVWPEFAAAHEEWQLLHLTGPLDEARVRSAYAAAGIACSSGSNALSGAPPGTGQPGRAVVQAFTHEMAAALVAADAVLSRAGASTLAELTALGRPAVLVPYPYHRDRHQHANARMLAERGAAIVVEDRREASGNAGPLREALEHIVDQQTRTVMSAAARSLGRPGAAEDLARWLAQSSGSRAD